MKKILSLAAAAAMAFSANAALSTTDFKSNNYIQEWGHLKLVGNQLCSEKGEAIQLKGWSAFGNFDKNCARSGNDLDQMKAWGANVVRLPEYPNVKSQTWGQFSESQFKQLIDDANARGMYVVADWHVLKSNDCDICGDPTNLENEGQFTTSATTFFKTISAYVKQKGYVHVIYELSNEPTQGVDFSKIKSYSERMINVITQNDDSKPIVIVATPNWDQEIGEAVNSPLNTSKAQVLYSFHLYANDDAHRDNHFPKFKNAVNKIPVFVSEWGLSFSRPEERASYDDVNLTFGKEFWNAMGGMYGQKVSWCNWSYGSKKEGASTFIEECDPSRLSKSGNAVIEMLGGNPADRPDVGECFATPFEFSTSVNTKDNIFQVSGFNNGGEGVGYHDCNNTPQDSFYTADGVLIQPTEKGKPGCQAATAEGYCEYRKDECVDITGCNGGINKVGEGYNIGWISSGEWLRYCIKVTDPGYYSIEVVGNPTTAGAAHVLTATIVEGFHNVACDIDASTPTEVEEITGFNFQECPDEYYDPSEPDEAAWMHWGWLKTSNPAGTSIKNHGVCFKEAGEYTLEIGFPTGFGDLGSLGFTYVKPYTGEGWSNDVKNKEVSLGSSLNVNIYYSQSAETISTNAEASKIEVLDIAGKLVASDNGKQVNVSNLSTGLYIVKVYTDEFGIVTKQIIKK
ncbi:MAG: cellulase family glycosylhydrolase [Paludibacteraceae bacterium]|nr:cellulase family glycosylhydrolase [Paludibacteraceae bacterium]